MCYDDGPPRCGGWEGGTASYAFLTVFFVRREYSWSLNRTNYSDRNGTNDVCFEKNGFANKIGSAREEDTTVISIPSRTCAPV